MNLIEIIFGVGLLLLAASIVFFSALPGQARKVRPTFRPIQAVANVRRAIGLAVEEGTRLHLTLGKSGILSPTNASALATLSALERIALLSSASDRPPIATAGDGVIALLSQDTLRAAFRSANSSDLFDPDLGRLTGTTPLAYVVGALPVVRSDFASANLMIGNFGPEVGFLSDASEQARALTVAGSDSLTAQAVLFATAQEVLIGEEAFAVSAYLGNPAHQASLRAQDTLRWVLVAALVIGAILTLAGVL